ncbi:MAG: hypothetical protein SPE20_07930 [Helicobacter sp.]|uniref:hypothetical protein n=1 Tax=Helicobacter sp. TaxID=218 RepID=UPI002A8366BD|nr:hypothetical protein [Helicobacter sp.]MDY4427265.1 hypothetical protein [Helicobacter sp.]
MCINQNISNVKNFNSINQNINNIYSANILSFIKQNEEYFYNGEFKKSFEILKEYKQDNSSDKKNNYLILINETKYYFDLCNYKKTKENLDYLEKEYKEFTDNSFKEIQLSLCMFEKDLHKFNDIKQYFLIEKQTNQSNEYFDFMYALNTGDIEQAKELFGSLRKNEKDDYLKTILYAQSFFKTQHEEDGLLFVELCETLLKDNKLNFLQKKNILEMLYEIEKFFTAKYNRSILENKNYIKDYQVILENIIQNDNLQYFEFDYQKYIKYNYCEILFSFKENDKFIEFYINNEDELFNYFYFSYIDITKNNIDHDMIQNKILETKNFIKLLYDYIVYFDIYKDKEVYNFLSSNYKLLDEHNLIFYFVKICLNSKFEITQEIKQCIASKPESDIIYYFLNLKLKNSVSRNELKELYPKLDTTLSCEFIKDIILFLQERNFNAWKDIILKFKDKYNGIIELALEYFLNSENIDIVEFENFIQNIDKSLYLEQIFNIYFKNKKYEKSLEIGKILWNDIRVDKIILSKNILLVLQQYYEAFQTNLDETLYVKAFNTLKANIDALDLKEIVQLLYHHIIFRKEVDEDLITKINRQLLRLSINEIDEVIINYVHLLFSIVTKIQRVTQDTILFDQKTKKAYINQRYYKEVSNSYEYITIIDEAEFYLKSNGTNYHSESLLTESLLSYIYITIIAKKDSLPFVKKINIDPNSPARALIEQIKSLMEPINQQRGELINKFHEKKCYLHDLKNGLGADYVDLIPYLIEEVNINFYSCKCIPYDGKKLLTFSSIVFLQHINKLDVVLKQENIFVPKSVFLYIKDEIESIEKSRDENYSLRSHGFIKKDMTKIKNKLQLILKMLNSNQIIDDTEEFISLCDELDIDTQKELNLFYICLPNQYQLITEDRFFGYLAEEIDAPQIVSNAMSLLIEEKDYIDQAILLDSKKYSYVFGEYVAYNINATCLYKNISSHNISNRDKQMLQIIDKYGFLDKLKQYYKNTYKVLYPKINIPKDNYVKHNIELLLNLLEKNDNAK